MESFIFPLLLLLLVLPLFLASRKQKRAMQEMQQLQSSLAPGDRVMTSSGLYGTVTETAEDTVDVEIAPGVNTTWVRAAIREKVVVADELPEGIDESDDDAAERSLEADADTTKSADSETVTEDTADGEKVTSGAGAKSAEASKNA
ncbi:preprotein translocase subunit YajC [Actinoalloteichus hoggarensis]|uniref:Preprotein translocase subunit YajC n=1 Tax=Actinoalloteichus hoggarensis TaxID=1470176 RepID=A0A221W2A3_9PSEU|nr:preprotein translocase subunit YajC [Actinoalloteichus hoggarensis]ASO19731.1 preprotein translocase subunit YajC [Actinoalloteichus hoggarensis]MBB5919563.1 preprotein translocase subunit YajC [Actinoalloteichus hoggarensis]